MRSQGWGPDPVRLVSYKKEHQGVYSFFACTHPERRLVRTGHNKKAAIGENTTAVNVFNTCPARKRAYAKIDFAGSFFWNF